ncbi:MAG TPA: TIGR00645 family protein [Steroidobacteraceae bacterium]
MTTDARVRPLGPLPTIIFSSRWLQLPLYLGLIVAQGVYVFLFLKELWHLIHGARALTEQTIMLIVLGLIDVVMISNLLVMVIVGGYETFVSRLNLSGHPDQPEWLSHVNASVLKVKLAMAIIGISSIHLLKTFIEAGNIGGMPLCGTAEGIEAIAVLAAAGSNIKGCVSVTHTGVMWQTIIHSVFILSAIGIAWTDQIMARGLKATAKH